MNPAPSAPTKTGVFWTQFSAASLTDRDGRPVDWSDHKAAHRAVSRLFQPRLPGAADERRTESGILYRVDVLGPDAEPIVLVQSLLAPELTPREHRSIEVSRRSWDVEAGAQVAFRIAVNPVTRTTRYYLDSKKETPAPWSNAAGTTEIPRTESGKRDRSGAKATARVVPVGEVAAWLANKVDGALGDLQVINHFRDKTRSGNHVVAVDTFDGIATVTDPDVLSSLRVAGVGRSKSYGCGLLTVTRLT